QQMKLYKRGNFLGMDLTVGGVRYRETTKYPISDRQGAQRFMAQEYTRRLNQVALGEKGEITVADAYDHSLAETTGKTLVQYELCKRKLLGEGQFEAKWHIPERSFMSSVNQKMVDDLRKNRLREGLTNNSVNIEIRVLRRVYNAVKDRYKVFPDLQFKQLKKFTKSRYLSRQEEDLVLQELQSQAENVVYEKALDLFLFLVDTGARLGEATSIEWADIRQNDRVIELYRDKTAKLSLIPLSNRAWQRLEARLDQRRPFMEMDRAIKLLRKVISNACNDNPRVLQTRGAATIHSLRDTYATRLHQKGMSLQKIAKLLGHSHATMAAKYSHLESDDVLEEARLMIDG
ncbi:MAG TPA: site-specific integrase, partial [Candidatus Obscuribacterales bacterium]